MTSGSDLELRFRVRALCLRTMLDRTLALILDEGKWPDLSLRRRVIGHLLAVTIKLASGTLSGAAPIRS